MSEKSIGKNIKKFDKELQQVTMPAVMEIKGGLI